MAAISNRYKPSERSANAKLLIKNFGTVTSFLKSMGTCKIHLNSLEVLSYQFENNTTNTAMFPKTARNTTIHTEVRNHWDPITSSHGFNASGTGKHCSMILLKKKTNIDLLNYSINKW